jgi:lysophospholipase L1-like esterase
VPGLILLRRSSTMRGSENEIATNSWGLRSEELSEVAAPNEMRIALLGASTIQGTYATRNDTTSAARLAQRLRSRSTFPALSVINAGVAGLSVAEQVVLLQKRLVPAGTKLLFWYPGANDISCRRPSEPDRRPLLKPPTLPRWVLTHELISKNTGVLRDDGRATRRRTGEIDFDGNAFAASLRRGVEVARAAKVDMRLLTIAAAYDSRQTQAERTRAAATALHFRPCMSVEELIAVRDQLNATIRGVAHETGVRLVDAATILGGRPDLFGDSVHFSERGERLFADLLAEDILRFPASPD